MWSLLLPTFPSGIINLLRYLDTEARKQGGAVYMLNGNHESLNVCGDFRWACGLQAVAGWAAFQSLPLMSVPCTLQWCGVMGSSSSGEGRVTMWSVGAGRFQYVVRNKS